ncbi:MAG: DegT/DnrJ/EryC1/StrS family aminotransferase [Solirubrobacterales bacterium]|nr:DegT/DnrJ/EryC1/StrS family aminotransferase [Solirubrobacterales bacterium]
MSDLRTASPVSLARLGGSPPLLPLFDLLLEEEDLHAVAETLRTGWLSMGPRTEAFEEAFAAHLGAKHAVAVANCTAALHLAYLTAGVGPGDEVIVPSYTFTATASAISYCGATPVFADIIGTENLSIDPEEVERLITPRTKAVAAVHFAGYAAPVDVLGVLCAEHGLALIEDAAHSPSATLNGRKLGTFGRASAFSLFSNKVLSVGEGGLLVTDDDDVAVQARRLRNHAMTLTSWDKHRGASGTYDVPTLGYNYRIDEPRSALALSRLNRLEQEIDRRRALTRRYRAQLAPIADVSIPFRDEDVDTSSCYVMPILLRDSSRRDSFRLRLRERHRIQTSIFYPPIHLFTVYRKRYPGVRLPRTEGVASKEVTIPLFPHMTIADQDRVLEAIAEEVRA